MKMPFVLTEYFLEKKEKLELTFNLVFWIIFFEDENTLRPFKEFTAQINSRPLCF